MQQPQQQDQVAPSALVEQAARFQSSFCEEAALGGARPTPLLVLTKSSFPKWLQEQSAERRGWLKSYDMEKFKAGKLLALPAERGEGEEGGVPFMYVFTVADRKSPYAYSSLPGSLPPATYALRFHGEEVGPDDLSTAVLSWSLGAYKYERYKKKKTKQQQQQGVDKRPVLSLPVGFSVKGEGVGGLVEAIYMVRDLITTPAEDVGPAQLQECVEALARECGASSVRAIVGDDLLKENYPQIHAVGRAADPERSPRLLELCWTSPSANSSSPLVALVGKGVCFDTGGLDLKPAAGMLTMKKDMGGAAIVLGMAKAIMSDPNPMPIRLRVLIAAVENSVSGNSYRPGDVITARNGLTTEVLNTDAEGRLILADALVDADSESDPPALIIDCATLTGAARVALGGEVPCVFCNDPQIARTLQQVSSRVRDQVWWLPLWKGYAPQIKSDIADLKNIADGPMGGAIIAALYLQNYLRKPTKPTEEVDNTGEDDEANGEEGEELVDGHPPREQTPWIHMDVNAYNNNGKPGRPKGGEAQGMRALLAFLKEHFGDAK